MTTLRKRNSEPGFVPTLEDALFESALHNTGCFHHWNGNDIAIGHDEGSGRFTIWLINESKTNTQLGSVLDSLPWENLVETIKMIIHCVFM